MKLSSKNYLNFGIFTLKLNLGTFGTFGTFILVSLGALNFNGFSFGAAFLAIVFSFLHPLGKSGYAFERVYFS